MTLRATVLYEDYKGPFRQWRSQLRARNVDSTKVDGFFAFARELEQQLGVRLEHAQADLGQLDREIDAHESDLVLFLPNWANWHADTSALAESVARAHAKPARPALALFDASDPSSSPFLDLLPLVDVFLKSQLPVDRDRYTEDIAGGYCVAEWVQNALDFDLGDWHLGEKADPALLPRLAQGWTMGISRFYRRLAAYADRFAEPLEKRDFDLNRRFGKPDPATSSQWDWYQEYRRYSATAVENLRGLRMTQMTPLPQFAYLREMMRCRAVFSPFGWGEICFRDYEAVACGAVLVKPDVAHLACHPDIFVADETYVPVAWDLSDLAEKLEWLRDAPHEAERIARNARERLRRAVIRDGFIEDFRQILVRTGLARGASALEEQGVDAACRRD